jgi:hypothetical protein
VPDPVQTRPDIIANQMFIGCPGHGVRTKYKRVIRRLNREFSISFVIIARTGDQKAREGGEKYDN